MAAPPIPPFAQLLRRYRRERSLTQEALAEVAGLSARGIRALEQGERTAPHTDTVRLLAGALQLSPSDRATFEAAARHLSAGQAVDRDMAPPTGSFLGARPSGPLVAREGELVQALRFVEEVERGGGRLVMLAGEPGVGKTRLAQEVMLRLEERGFLLATGRCYEPEQVVPYYPFVEALAAAYDAAPVTLQSEVPRRWPYVERLLPDHPSATDAEEFGGQDVQQRLFWAVAHFLDAIAELRPLAVLLDDLQWADESSLKLLQYLARATRASRTFLLGTYRDIDIDRRHPLDRALRDLHREGLLTEIIIRRLPEEGTAALTTAMLGDADMPEALVALLHERTDGNPFFIQEVVRALIERGDLFVADGFWTSHRGAEIEVPRSIRSAIGERLARLTDVAQEVLSEASVLGQAFAVSDLRAMRGRPEGQIDDALDEALIAGLIRPTDRGRFSFNHALTQQTLYEELPARRRTRLHLLAAEAVERLPEPDRQKRAAELAWHFMQADEPARALSYSVLAGDAAEAMFAHAEAEQHYHTALELARQLGDLSRQAPIHEKLGTVLRLTGRYDQALHLLERAAGAYRTAGDLEGEARATQQIAFVHFYRGTTPQGIERVRRVVERFEHLPPDIRPLLAMADLYSSLARNLFPSARYAEVLAAADRALELARASQDERTFYIAGAWRGRALGMLGRFTEARLAFEETIPTLERVADPWWLAQAVGNIGRSYVHEGNLERAKECCERAVQLVEASHDPAETSWALCVLGDALLLLGQWAEARISFERAAEVGRSARARYYSYALLHLGELSFVEGRSEEAKQHIEEAIDMAQRSGEVPAIRKAAQLLAERDLAAGNPKSAVARLEPLAGELGEDEPHAFPPPVLAEAYLAVGHVDHAYELVRRRLERFRARDQRRALALWLRVQGMILRQQQRWEEADRVFADALSLARDMPYPYAEGRSLYEYGVLHVQRAEPEQAREVLGEALAIFRHLGARPDVERTKHALHALG